MQAALPWQPAEFGGCEGDNISDYEAPLSSALFKFSSVIFRTSEFLFGINKAHTFKILWWQPACAFLSVSSPLQLKRPTATYRRQNGKGKTLSVPN